MAGYPSFNAVTDKAGPEHYQFLRIPKMRRTRAGARVPVLEPGRNGRLHPKMRKISAPIADLKKAQRALLLELNRQHIGATPWAHAYVRGRSIRTNALPHVGARAVLTIDIKDFFQSITPDMVRRALGFVLRSRRQQNRLIGSDWRLLQDVDRLCFVNGGLPQGGPASPFLSNLVGAKLDYKINKLISTWRRRVQPRIRINGKWVRLKPTAARIHPIRYTRYCDDLTFSSDYEDLWVLRHSVERILKSTGLLANPNKIRTRTRGSRLLVCGVVVNKVLSTPRQHRRALRSRLHRLICNAHYGVCPRQTELVCGRPEPVNFNQLTGMVAHIDHINPEQGAAFRVLLDIAKDVHNNTDSQYTDVTINYLTHE